MRQDQEGVRTADRCGGTEGLGALGGQRRSLAKGLPARALPALLAACLGAGASHAAEAPADLVLRGARVHTMDAARSTASAVAVRDGLIVYVGTDAGASAFIGETTRALDLPGRTVLPGFQDAHVHPVTSGVEVLLCDLAGRGTPDEVLAEVARCAERQQGEWLTGAGWQLPVFPAANPRKEALDAIVGDRPALLHAADGHSAWASSAALARAGIDASTPDPPNGRIERDPETGEPTGTLREDAIGLVERLVPPSSLEQRLAGLLHAQEQLLARGVTTVQEASARRPELEAYAAAWDRGRLELDVVVAMRVEPEHGPEQVAELVEWRERFARPRVRPTAAKIFLDGVIEARTAAMLAPYDDRPGDPGTLEWERANLHAVVQALAATGFDVHIHAIGDRAVREALDAFEAAAEAAGPRRLRHQIAHLEVIQPADVPRFPALGVTAVFQPLWAFADSYIVDLTWPALGPERSRWIYPMGSVARAGGTLAFGSDWSVSSLNPLDGIEVAATRQDPDDPERAEPMQPEERLELGAAVAAYTAGAAWALRRETTSGTLEVGKEADLVVLDRDLFAVAPAAINQAVVELTVADGKVVYEAASPE